MVDNPAQYPSAESLKQAAAEAVRQGVDIRSKVHDLTLLALTQYRFDSRGMRDVIRAATEGIATGAQEGPSGMRQVLADGLKGMDQALGKSAEAGAAALKQLAAAGKGFSDNELKTALASLRKIEHDFVSTVSHVADAAGTQVRPSLREALGAMTRTGTETGRQLAHIMNEFAHRFTIASIDATIAGLDAASEFGTRFASLASGILSGVADALENKPKPLKPHVRPKAD